MIRQQPEEDKWLTTNHVTAQVMSVCDCDPFLVQYCD